MAPYGHVERLLCLLTLVRWCVLVGVLKAWPLKRHSRWAGSVVTLGLRPLVRTISLLIDRQDREALILIELLEPSQTI
ncbi:hypothetical protein ACVWZX_004206 [Deinococcus sp. UYEF24]